MNWGGQLQIKLFALNIKHCPPFKHTCCAAGHRDTPAVVVNVIGANVVVAGVTITFWFISQYVPVKPTGQVQLKVEPNNITQYPEFLQYVL